MSKERRLNAIPRWVPLLFGVALGIEILVASRLTPPSTIGAALPAAPSISIARLAAFGEPVAAAKLTMLWLQAFDFQSGTRTPYRDLDYHALIGWLERIVELDPRGQYPLMSAARLYAEVPDATKQRAIIDWIYQEFLRDPNRRWPWAAHAAIIAKHQLHDLQLARKLATALQQRTTDPKAPVWVRTMELFVLEDLDELESAKVLIGGILSSGLPLSEHEAKLLERRLQQLEARQRDTAAVP